MFFINTPNKEVFLVFLKIHFVMDCSAWEIFIYKRFAPPLDTFRSFVIKRRAWNFRHASLEKYSLEMDMCPKHVENKVYWSLIWKEEDNIISLPPFLFFLFLVVQKAQPSCLSGSHVCNIATPNNHLPLSSIFTLCVSFIYFRLVPCQKKLVNG